MFCASDVNLYLSDIANLKYHLIYYINNHFISFHIQICFQQQQLNISHVICNKFFLVFRYLMHYSNNVGIIINAKPFVYHFHSILDTYITIF